MSLKFNMGFIQQEELSLLKRQNVSRSFSFRLAILGDSDNEEHDAAPKGKIPKIDHGDVDESHGCESLGVVRVSTKQVCFLENFFPLDIEFNVNCSRTYTHV